MDDAPALTIPHAELAAAAPLATELLATVSPSAMQLLPADSDAPGAVLAPAATHPGREDKGASAAVGAPQEASHVDATPLPNEALRSDEGLPDASVADEALSDAPPAECQGSVQLEPTAASPAIQRDETVGAASHRAGGPLSQTERPVDTMHFMRSAVEVNVAVWSYLHNEGRASFAYLEALSRANSPTSALDLQTREMTRALDAYIEVSRTIARQMAPFSL
jgi:hypothetical protein